MPATPIVGGCHCEKISYVVSGACHMQFVCHCSSCQKLNGGSRLAGAVFPRKNIHVRGELSTYDYEGGKDTIKLSFCPSCGTHILAEPKSMPDVIVVRANTYADRTRFKPGKNIFNDTMPAWDQLLKV